MAVEADQVEEAGRDLVAEARAVQAEVEEEAAPVGAVEQVAAEACGKQGRLRAEEELAVKVEVEEPEAAGVETAEERAGVAEPALAVEEQVEVEDQV